ncbi:MAG: DUF2263 domain-containing protein [Candidatus Marinimicrobia bacterium]|nr:DUF2263 domain-containing protein [Candidatus Neomarinimicrobiota bacterium]
MPGRRLLSEDDYIDPRYNPKHPEMVRRRDVLQETLDRFANADLPNKYHLLAQTNLQRWFDTRDLSTDSQHVHVVSGDWGEVTHSMTKKYGKCFAVLNMANAFVPGGAYVEGTVAQEEYMFRRTDCHFHVNADEYDASLDRYVPEMTSLLSAEKGKVYLDSTHPRVCIRGPEKRSRPDLGYVWLADDEVFPFFELRASAQDLRDGSQFSESSMRQRIAAQLDTLMDQNINHVIFKAFGCGAFMNPADRVAKLYREEIHKRQRNFAVIAFAIYNAGYGSDNYTPFRQAFRDQLKLS